MEIYPKMRQISFWTWKGVDQWKLVLGSNKKPPLPLLPKKKQQRTATERKPSGCLREFVFFWWTAKNLRICLDILRRSAKVIQSQKDPEAFTPERICDIHFFGIIRLFQPVEDLLSIKSSQLENSFTFQHPFWLENLHRYDFNEEECSTILGFACLMLGEKSNKYSPLHGGFSSWWIPWDSHFRKNITGI